MRLGVAALLLTIGCDGTAPEVAAPSPAEVLDGRAAAIAVRLETGEGVIDCAIDPAHAPATAALFVGLAQGGHAWRDPRTGDVVTRPLYDDTTFHRGIPRVLVQFGCPIGNGTGHPGYRIPLEPRGDDAALLAVPGVLFAATYTPPPGRVDPDPPPPGHVVGSQLAIGLRDMSYLVGRTTVLGHCEDLEVVRVIAEHVPVPLERIVVE